MDCKSVYVTEEDSKKLTMLSLYLKYLLMVAAQASKFPLYVKESYITVLSKQT